MSGGADAPQRRVLPNRREALTETLAVGSFCYDASIGFDPETGAPKEIFLSGARDGTDMAAILSDTSVVVSVALQHGIPAATLAHSIARLPAEYGGGAASVIGAALDLLVRCEAESRHPAMACHGAPWRDAEWPADAAADESTEGEQVA